MSWALAGQILVTIILSFGVAVALLLGVARLGRRVAERAVASADIAEPHAVTPSIPIDGDDDEEHEDSEHMRVLREHQDSLSLPGMGSSQQQHRSIPYRRGGAQ